jgi:hypothetical protein
MGPGARINGRHAKVERRRIVRKGLADGRGSGATGNGTTVQVAPIVRADRSTTRGHHDLGQRHRSALMGDARARLRCSLETSRQSPSSQTPLCRTDH